MKNEAGLRPMKRAFGTRRRNGCALLNANEVSASWWQRRRFINEQSECFILFFFRFYHFFMYMVSFFNIMLNLLAF